MNEWKGMKKKHILLKNMCIFFSIIKTMKYREPTYVLTNYPGSEVWTNLHFSFASFGFPNFLYLHSKIYYDKVKANC